jgi:hypothetical protein
MSTLWGVSIFFLLAGLVALWLQGPATAAGDGPVARLRSRVWSPVWSRVSSTRAGHVLTVWNRLLSNPLYLRVLAAYAAVLSAVWFWVLVIVTPAIGQATGGAVEDESLRWHYLVLGSMTLGFVALAGAPFAVGRADSGDRRPGTVEPGDVPGRIARAMRQLGAERTAGVDALGKSIAIEHAEPDLELRISAIRALARIAQDSEHDHIPIMESLCAYVCEITRARPAVEPDLADWAPPPDDMTPESRARHAQDFAGWIAALPPLRADIQAALDVIGHRSEDRVRAEQTGKRRLRVNLGGARLQRANLEGVRLDGANLSAARLEGADLGGARLEGANLWGVRLQGADLGGARLERADLGRARLERANLLGARLDGANLNGARLDGANLGGARLEGADLGGALRDGADLGGARL